jgi:trans-aconitate methyltransferase
LEKKTPIVEDEEGSHSISMDELADRIIGHYERHALEWDADRRNSAWNDRKWHARFVAELPAGASVLDLGCGSGVPVGRFLAERGFSVTGVDASPTMISLCRNRLPHNEWVMADMRMLALGRHFGGILAWDSFFHLSCNDQREMFQVFAAHAAPGAGLMFNTGPSCGVAIGQYQGDPLYHASLDPAEYRELMEKAGFEIIAHVQNDSQAGGRTVWLGRKCFAR